MAISMPVSRLASSSWIGVFQRTAQMYSLRVSAVGSSEMAAMKFASFWPASFSHSLAILTAFSMGSAGPAKAELARAKRLSAMIFMVCELFAEGRADFRQGTGAAKQRVAAGD